MKQIIACVFFAFFLVSCGRTHKCKCTYTDSYGNTVDVGFSNLEGSKKKAKAACDSKSSEWTSVNGKCEIQD